MYPTKSYSFTLKRDIKTKEDDKQLKREIEEKKK